MKLVSTNAVETNSVDDTSDDGDSDVFLSPTDSDTNALDAGQSDTGQSDTGQSVLDGLTTDERCAAVRAMILGELDEDKAEDIVTIELSGKSDIADAMIIASGRSQRHVSAIADKVLRRLKNAGIRSLRSEGQPACDWVLIDAGDVVVHVFRPEVRAFYNLERIWSETAHASASPGNPASRGN